MSFKKICLLLMVLMSGSSTFAMEAYEVSKDGIKEAIKTLCLSRILDENIVQEISSFTQKNVDDRKEIIKYIRAISDRDESSIVLNIYIGLLSLPSQEFSKNDVYSNLNRILNESLNAPVEASVSIEARNKKFAFFSSEKIVETLTKSFRLKAN